jgi:hypothetical protein
MGIQMSKASVLAQGACKYQGQDDMTKATDNTDGSSVTSSPRNSAYTDKQSQRRIGSGADPITRLARPLRRWRRPEPAAPRHTAMPRTYSDPLQPLRRSESLPVKCPPRRRNNSIDGTSEECEESSDQLMKMYDARTWALYAKITEHRKHHPAAYNQSALDKSAHDEVAEWNNRSDTCSSTPQSGHEMIFLFDL